MTDEVEVEMSAFDIGVINALGAIAIALKASPGFNNDALKKVTQMFLDVKVPLPFRGAEAEEAYARPLRIILNDQPQVMQWLGQDEPKH
ncbi:hypothetical protein [Pseudomonas syringae]|uniref:hypothetical protein n=1 Tax=Pseudomonas syringae TaxID=317 RepID=UPI0004655409|nr:hypothetical protein [Pseudomonas syringae]QGG75838.1 hypothetical protein N028_10900 [Pseudomonas syringae USA011]